MMVKPDRRSDKSLWEIMALLFTALNSVGIAVMLSFFVKVGRFIERIEVDRQNNWCVSQMQTNNYRVEQINKEIGWKGVDPMTIRDPLQGRN